MKENNTDTYSWDASSNEDKQGEMAKRVAVYSNGSEELKGYDRVLVLLEYEVPEMEYFSSQALPFLKDLLNKYHDKDIKIQHFYSDEMHIQQDWIYFDHHDNGQLALRYYSPAMGEAYQQKFGVPFEEKDILYFAYGPDIDCKSAKAIQHVQYIRGESPEEIHRTFLFRDRYYKMLNTHVVDLFKDAKQYAGELFGVDDFGTFGHSSWAESPTVDLWNVGDLNPHASKYEYTPNFIWGNTVQQAAAACYDYFKWGEYLEPTRNDFAELGWNDRNYYGAAMSASIGVLNRIPQSYPAFWGMPHKVRERKTAINDAYGGSIRSQSLKKITGAVHRDVDVLILYPMNLVALFEPLPQKGLLDLMADLKNEGGKLFWFGPPPVVDGSGENCSQQWQDIFGIKVESGRSFGQVAAGKRIDFTRQLNQLDHQYILTDFIIDLIHPVQVEAGTSALAYCDGQLYGTANNGAYFFGFRPRDDQSASLGYESKTLFEILDGLGAYPATGTFAETNDNTEHISRTTDYLATGFPNGATAIVRHYKNHRESWDGGFSRNPEEDAAILLANPLPSDLIALDNFKVNGHSVTYNGRLTMAFRTNQKQELIAFEGLECNQIEIDGKVFRFSEEPMRKIAFVPSMDESIPGIKIYAEGKGKLQIPIPGSVNPYKIYIVDEKGKKINYDIIEDAIVLEVNSKISGKWLSLR